MRINQSESKASVRLAGLDEKFHLPRRTKMGREEFSIGLRWRPHVEQDPVSQECKAMRMVLGAIVASAALVATDASAQGVNLTGQYRCIEGCYAARPGQFAYVTQNGWELNVVNDAGLASRAWLDYPGRIWVAQANMGAIYSPDGMTMQFDNGTVWQRAPELPPAPPRRRR
jgi:hypothetical protein